MSRTIVVIGAGFSGTMLTVQLLQQSAQAAIDTKIVLIGDKGFGRGQAYGTSNPAHLLNVRADNMSAWPDRPDDFLNWLRDGFGEDGRGRFIGRARYGAYIRHVLAKALWQGGRRRVSLLRGQVSAIQRGALPHDQVTIMLHNGQRIVADRVVLATGNFPPANLPQIADDVCRSKLYIADPWTRNVAADLPKDAPVLLIGSGLTMVDVVISLLRAGHIGKITALSRHGALPLVHAATSLPPQPIGPDADIGLMSLLRALRIQAKNAVPPIGWQRGIDGLRSRTIAIWQHWSDTERSRFLRHPRRLWEVHRHRMAPEIAHEIDSARARGQFTLIAGHLKSLMLAGDLAEMHYQPRGLGAAQTLRASRVVNCAGPATDYRRLQDPLLRSLLESGIARPDCYRLGFDIAPSNALIAADDTISSTIYAVGPMTKAAYWEIVAVPDIRQQCAALAANLLSADRV